jgi:hypothetical protein
MVGDQSKSETQCKVIRGSPINAKWGSHGNYNSVEGKAMFWRLTLLSLFQGDALSGILPWDNVSNVWKSPENQGLDI